LGLFDQFIHSHPEAADDISGVWARINAEHWPIVPTANTSFAAGFGHLAGGYDAQYYGAWNCMALLKGRSAARRLSDCADALCVLCLFVSLFAL
jgi:hypothetical protein